MEAPVAAAAPYIIYPERRSKHANFAMLPVFVFLVGNGQKCGAYSEIFTKLTAEAEMIVYCLEIKSIEEFREHINHLSANIEHYYEIPRTSSRYYIGGHGLGGTIALNSVFPANFHSKMRSYTMHAVDLPLAGFICFDPVDGTQGENANYSLRTKYDPNNRTLYVTSHGEINPYPILIFSTPSNSSEMEECQGKRMFRALCNLPSRRSSFYGKGTALNNYESDKAAVFRDKYCFVSEGKFQSSDYLDVGLSTSESIQKALAAASKNGEGRMEEIQTFHGFIVSKIISFIFDDMDVSSYEDFHLCTPTPSLETTSMDEEK
jgi:hypothetical protein